MRSMEGRQRVARHTFQSPTTRDDQTGSSKLELHQDKSAFHMLAICLALPAKA